MFDDEIARFLEALDRGFPPVQEMTAQQAREAISARRADRDAEPVHEVTEHQLSTPDTGPLLRVYRPHGEPGAPALVFCHGGGFVFCDLDSHDAFCRWLCRSCSVVVVSVGYRRAPEHRAPAAAEDAYRALRWTAEECAGIDADRIAVAGDSAGGNLAAVCCLLARERSGPRPAGQVLLYPLIDPGCDTASQHRYATGHVNTRAAMRWYWHQYLGSAELPEPRHAVAPLRAARHTGLPPAVVVTAGLDPLSDEGRAYAGALRAAGVGLVHRHHPDLFHGFATVDGLEAASCARELLAADVRDLFDQPIAEVLG